MDKFTSSGGKRDEGSKNSLPVSLFAKATTCSVFYGARMTGK